MRSMERIINQFQTVHLAGENNYDQTEIVDVSINFRRLFG
jgi:hypothetical protein